MTASGCRDVPLPWLVDPVRYSIAPGFRGRNIADWCQKSSVIETIYPFQGGQFHGLEAAPRPAPMNDLCLVKSVDGLGERVVAARADAADRGFNPGIKQPFVYFIEIYFEVGADGLPVAVQRRISACVAYRPTRVRIMVR
jgi:hypothetical protein